MIRKSLLLLVVILGSLCAEAQYFQFSQYNFTGQRINPASVASSNYASLSFLYRNQATSGDFNLASSMVSGAYPLLSRNNGRRWGGVGVALLDDRSGVAGIFNTQEAAVSFATNVYLSKWQALSFGAKWLYQLQKNKSIGIIHRYAIHS
jgi:type IX secretion system PorP/SprF family membrane protein